MDNIDIRHARSLGIDVINAPEAPADSVAELTIGLMISLARKIPVLDRCEKGGWRGEWALGRELRGKTLGIIGLGRIGSRVAIAAKALGMRVVAYDPYIDKGKAERVGAELKSSLDELLKTCDFLSIHVPLNDETRGMIGARELSLMKKESYLINTSRGAVVDEKALFDALASGKLAGAALDVLTEEPPVDNPLLKLKGKVLITPHIGGFAVEAQRRIAITLAEKILSFPS